MKPLFFDSIDDGALLDTLAPIGKHNREVFANRATIRNEYARYRDVLVRPTRNSPVITDGLSEALRRKYAEGRSGNGVFTFIEDRAEKPEIASCPYCGRAGVGTLDHFLPQEYFAWFSVFSLNLIPACSVCQGIKGAKIGEVRSARPIHPLCDAVDRSQRLVVRPVFYDTDVSSATFRFGLQPDRSFSRRIRKREKFRYTQHWQFFGEDREDVRESCRSALRDIRIDLNDEMQHAGTVVVDAPTAKIWFGRELNRALKYEDRSSLSLLHVGLLRAFANDVHLAATLMATQLPMKALSRANQLSMLRRR